MKREKPKNLDSSSKPSKKSKVGTAGDDLSLSNGGQSEEVSNMTVGQTPDKPENNEKKKLGKRQKGGQVKHSMITSARKKGRLSVDSKGSKTLPKAAGDSALKPTSNVAKEKRVINSSPIPVILGLQCNSVTVSQSKNAKQLTSNSPQDVVKPGTPQLGAPLAPKETDNQEGKEKDSDTITKRKRGRPFKRLSKNANNQNGSGSVKMVPNRTEIDSTSQQEKYNKTVTGKRGKRRMIRLNIVSPPQDVEDSSKQTENENSENNVEKSLDTVSDDQPLSRWFHGKQTSAALESTGKKPPEISIPSVTNGDGQTLTFEKRSSLWETIESMEAFRLIPQKPHFRPLDNIKETARERHAINKMVDFSGVFEETRRLQIDHPRTEIEDQLDTLSELETHGFDISFIRNRLMELLSLKDKLEGLGSRSKEVKDNVQNHRVVVQKYDDEIELINKKVSDLREKRDRVLKEKEKKDSEIVDLEAEIWEIKEGMRECVWKFDELASTSFR